MKKTWKMLKILFYFVFYCVLFPFSIACILHEGYGAKSAYEFMFSMLSAISLSVILGFEAHALFEGFRHRDDRYGYLRIANQLDGKITITDGKHVIVFDGGEK